MAQIKIIAVPRGEAPLGIRQQWVEMILPVAENLPPDTLVIGVLSGKLEPKNQKGYSVETTVAIQELEKKSPGAARWWRAVIPATIPTWLSFSPDVCQFVP